MPMVATDSSVATHSCSFEYLSPGGASMIFSQIISRRRSGSGGRARRTRNILHVLFSAARNPMSRFIDHASLSLSDDARPIVATDSFQRQRRAYIPYALMARVNPV